jgi:ferric-dicitrate binding protein FerR (iron transport regulator)
MGGLMDAVKRIQLDRRLLLGLGSIAFAGPDSVWAQDARAVGLVRAVSGRAEAEREAQRRILSQEASVFVGDRIATGVGARAVFSLGAATELRLGAEARIRIDRFLINAGGVLNLEGGAVVIDKAPTASGGSLSLRSSHGLIAVRGTRFFAGQSNGVFGVFVERGSVAVTAAGRQVLLNPGEGTDIAAPGAPPTDPKAWGQKRIQAALAQVY